MIGRDTYLHGHGHMIGKLLDRIRGVVVAHVGNREGMSDRVEHVVSIDSVFTR